MNTDVQQTVSRYRRPLESYAASLLRDRHRAADVVQDVFTRLVAHEVVGKNGELAPWLFAVCRHACIDELRKNRRLHELEQDVPMPLTPDPLEARDEHDRVLAAVKHLPPRQQELVRLKFQHGHSYKQMARITGLSVGNVGLLLSTALKSLRERLSETN